MVKKENVFIQFQLCVQCLKCLQWKKHVLYHGHIIFLLTFYVLDLVLECYQSSLFSSQLCFMYFAWGWTCGLTFSPIFSGYLEKNVPFRKYDYSQYWDAAQGKVL